MENRTHTERPQGRHLPFSDPFSRRRRDDDTDDEINRMENEGGPPPVTRKDAAAGVPSGLLRASGRGPLRGVKRART